MNDYFMANEPKSNIERRPAALPMTILVSLAVLLLTTGFGCKGVSKEVAQASRPFTLKYWRVFDDADTVSQAILAYRTLHPNVNIDYRKFRFEEYEKAVLDAMAEDQGPDIFSLHNTWLREWQPRLEPAPAVVNVPFREIRGTIKKEAITVLRQLPGPSIKQLANDFVDGVSDDVVIPTEQADPRAPLMPRIYGLPLSVDTLVMYYNRDILNASGITQPAVHWLEFQEQVKKITKLDEVGTIIQSAAALGTADNIERSMDILSLLMMQNGTQMTDDNGMATFDRYTPETSGQQLPPGAAALIFYHDFANPEKEVYTWNDKMPNSLQAFADGRVAYFFGYAYHLPLIRSMSPELNFGIANFPQIENNKPINYANYWVEVVSKKTKHRDEAWDFVQFVTKAEQAQKYLSKTGKPTALRSLVNSQLESLDLSVFASQVPTAKSWYHGLDAEATEKTFVDMIKQVHEGDADPVKIMELGATKVNQTIK